MRTEETQVPDREESRGSQQEGGRRGGPRRRRIVWGGAGAALAVALGLSAWSLWPSPDLESVTLLGVEYTSNMPLNEHGGYVYVTIPVNSDGNAVVLEVADTDDNGEIREFLSGLDTMVPGEHVLALRESNLHFIVDGIDGIDGTAGARGVAPTGSSPG